MPPIHLQAQRPFLKLHLAKELEQSFWTMLPVVVLKPDLWTALAIQLAFTTVPTLKMLVSDVWVSNHSTSVKEIYL